MVAPSTPGLFPIILKSCRIITEFGEHPSGLLMFVYNVDVVDWALVCKMSDKTHTYTGSGEASDTLHILTLLKDIMATFSLNSVKSVCETILRVMTLSNVVSSTDLQECGEFY
jgi:hypothetical protein